MHHKTEFGSNLTGHGYPDPGHLDNVLEELKAQGITEEECLPRDWTETQETRMESVNVILQGVNKNSSKLFTGKLQKQFDENLLRVFLLWQHESVLKANHIFHGVTICARALRTANQC